MAYRKNGTQDPTRTQDAGHYEDPGPYDDPGLYEDPVPQENSRPHEDPGPYEDSELFSNPRKTQELDFHIMCLIWWNLKLKANLLINAETKNMLKIKREQP